MAPSNQGASTSKPSTNSEEMQPKDKSDYRFLKDGGYRNMQHFLQSYCLKLGDDEDLEEGKQILLGLREIEQAQWEEKQAEKNRTLSEQQAHGQRRSG
jgi:hypothetical protein